MPTLCISNGGQSAINETNIDKINGSEKLKVSSNKPATAHTRDRCTALRTEFKNEKTN